MIGNDYTSNGSWIACKLVGEIDIPATGWKYWTGKAWLEDTSLTVK